MSNTPKKWDELGLLLAHDDDATPYDASVLADDVQEKNVPATKKVKQLADPTANSNLLKRQRWSVAIPEGANAARYLALVEDLIEQRAADQQHEVQVIRVPVGLDMSSAFNWRVRHFPEQYGGRELDRPRYLLLMGDLDEISLETQLVLGVDSFPGRLVCRSDDGYAAYVDKVLRWQRKTPDKTRGRALFYTADDGSLATTLGHQHLIEPLVKLSVETWRRRRHEFPAAYEPQDNWDRTLDPDGFLRLAGDPQPTVLFSLSHGKGPPRARRWRENEARLLQGAMQFGKQGAITHDDVGRGSFLPGGFWFYFACFGAGTPAQSAYHRWMVFRGKGREATEQVLAGLSRGRGFTSGIAQAALANPDGPLGIYGHVDLAWSHSFLTARGIGNAAKAMNRSHTFFQPLAKLLNRERAGAAFQMFQIEVDKINAEIAATHHEAQEGAGLSIGAPNQGLLYHLRMLQQDLTHFILLGDPAVRLPLGDPAQHGRSSTTQSSLVESVLGMKVTNAPQVSASVPAGEEMATTMELAVKKMLVGEVAVEELARRFHVTEDDLRRWLRIYREAGLRALAKVPVSGGS